MTRAASLGWAFATVVVSLVYWTLGVMSVPTALRSLSDDLLHGLAYALLGFLAAMAARRWLGRAAFPAGTCFAVLHGGILELLQRLNPARAAELSDLLADAVGACGGALVAGVVAGRWR